MKRKNIYKHLIFFPFLILLLGACKKEKQEVSNTQLQTENRVIIAHEGIWGQSTASLSQYNKEKLTIEHNVFQTINNRIIGDVLQDAKEYQEKLFLVNHNSHDIEITNYNTLEQITEATDPAIFYPRYIAFSGNNAFITNWGKATPDTPGHIAVMDINTGNVKQTIPVDIGPEGLIVYNDKYLFVANGNGFDNNFEPVSNHLISVIDLKSTKVIKEIDLSGIADLPRHITIDKNNKLWIFSVGLLSDNKPAKLVQINPETFEIEQTVTLGMPLWSGSLTTNKSKETLYFALEKDLYKMSIESNSPEPFITQSKINNILNNYYEDLNNLATNISTFAIDPHNDEIYLALPIDYAGKGRVIRFNNQGEFIDSFEANNIPSGFVF